MHHTRLRHVHRAWTSPEIAAAGALEAQAGNLNRALADSEASGDAAGLRTLNDTLMRLGRLLVPVGYTVRGQFDHDLGIPQPALPGLAQAAALATLDPTSDEAQMRRVVLRRQANRVRFALEEAAAAVEAVL